MIDLTGIALLRTIIPDEFADKLVLIAFNWRKDKFAIGDIRNSLKAMIEERCLPIATPDIDDFLAECLSHEVEPRTIRYYAMISYMFPEPTREMYRSLPHTHFAYAHSFGDEKSMGVLQLSKDREQSTGKAPTVAWLRATMSGYIYEQNSRMFSDDLGESGIKITNDDDLGGTEPPQEESEPTTQGWLISLQRAVEFGIKHIDAVPIPSEARLKLSDLLEQVDSLLGQYIMV